MTTVDPSESLRLLTYDDVADITQLPVTTLRYMRYQGYGPPSFKLGRQVRFDPEDVLQWIADQREAAKDVTPTEDNGAQPIRQDNLGAVVSETPAFNRQEVSQSCLTIPHQR